MKSGLPKEKAVNTNSPALIAVLSCLFFVCSCGKGDRGAGGKNDTFPVTQNKVKGPLEVTVSLDKEKISLADVLNLYLEMKIEKAYSVNLEEGDFFKQGEFILRDIKEHIDSDTEYKYITRIFTLEPNFSGTFTIQPLTIEFKKEDEQETYSLRTDPVSVTVEGLSEEDRKKLVIKDIEGPKGFPQEDMPVYVYAVTALILGCVTAGLLFYRKFRKRKRQEIQMPPFQKALLRLKELGAKGYIEQEQYEEFYYGITWIIRAFISDQFDIHAPESTTEEFLEDMEKSNGFPAKYKPKLREYLDHCDMVKYARYAPDKKQIQNIFNATKEFILFAGKPKQSSSVPA